MITSARICATDVIGPDVVLARDMHDLQVHAELGCPPRQELYEVSHWRRAAVQASRSCYGRGIIAQLLDGQRTSGRRPCVCPQLQQDDLRQQLIAGNVALGDRVHFGSSKYCLKKPRCLLLFFPPTAQSGFCVNMLFLHTTS